MRTTLIGLCVILAAIWLASVFVVAPLAAHSAAANANLQGVAAWSTVGQSVFTFLYLLATLGLWIVASGQLAHHEVQLIMAFQIRYDEAEMQQAVRSLAKWKSEMDAEEKNFIHEYVHSDDANKRAELDKCRRTVSLYFRDIEKLLRARLVERRVAKIVLAQPGINIFYEVVTPINQLLHGQEEATRTAATLKKVIPRYGRGLY